MKHTPTRTTLAAALAAGAMLLAACGGSDTTTDATPDTSIETPAETTEIPVAPTDSTEVPAETETSADSIVDIAVDNPEFSVLVSLLEATGLTDALAGDGPFTVFAPTDEAFARVPAEILEKLQMPENMDALTAVLTFHVLSGSVYSDQVTAGEVEMLSGAKAKLSTDDGVKIGDAAVVVADVAARNGVIHVIDTVLIPADIDLAAL